MFKDRLGNFGIPKEMIEDNPGLVQEILSTVIVVRAEYMWASNIIEYTGLSHSFQAKPPGALPSKYRYVTENGKFKEWVRINE